MGFLCEICGKVFLNAGNLSNHQKCKHNLHQEVFNCENCPFQCEKPYMLRKHRILCQKRTRNIESTIRKNTKRKLPTDKEPLCKKPRNYNCRICGEGFPNRRELYIHQHTVSISEFICLLVYLNLLI